jgi:hypothetical protein
MKYLLTIAVVCVLCIFLGAGALNPNTPKWEYATLELTCIANDINKPSQYQYTMNWRSDTETETASDNTSEKNNLPLSIFRELNLAYTSNKESHKIEALLCRLGNLGWQINTAWKQEQPPIQTTTYLLARPVQ